MRAKNYPYVGDYNLDPPDDPFCENCGSSIGGECSSCTDLDDGPYDDPEPDPDYYPY